MRKPSFQASRSMYGFLAMALLLAVLGIQHMAGFLMLRVARDSKERDLQTRLADLGQLAAAELREPALSLGDLALDAALARGGDLDNPDPQIYRRGLSLALTRPFDDFAARARLARLAVIDENGRVLYDTAESSRPLQRFEFLAVDPSNIKRAFAGEANSLPAYRFRDELYQRHYVPVFETTRAGATAAPHAILCLMAGKSFLRDLDLLASRLRRIELTLTTLLAGVVALIYILTQRQRAAERKAARAASEADRLASLGTLAAGFAHELRNPLGIIRASTEELLNDLKDGRADESSAEMCGDIIEEVDRMNRLVSQFLNFSRAGVRRAAAGAPAPARPGEPAEPEQTNLAAVTEQIAAATRPAAAKRNVELTLALPSAGSPMFVPMAPSEFRQILLNLLLNAIDASPAGGGVRIEAAAAQGRAHLSVSDSGAGVSPENAARLFEPFFTTKPSGAGLGLAISRQLALAAGGTLELDGVHKPGARFTLTLPLIKPSGARPGEAPSTGGRS